MPPSSWSSPAPPSSWSSPAAPRPLHVPIFLRETNLKICNGKCEDLTEAKLGTPHFNQAKAHMDDDRGDRQDPNAHKTRRTDCLEYTYVPRHAPIPQTLDCPDTDNLAYYQVTAPSGPPTKKYINYWFFYRFNNIPFGGGVKHFNPTLRHEGDWEGVTVAIDLGDPRTFTWVGFTAHGKFWRYRRGALFCNSAERHCDADDKRVNTYVGAGTHANYPFKCGATTPVTCNQTDASKYGIKPIDQAPEAGHDGETAWRVNHLERVFQRLPTASESTWVDFRGNWNENNDTMVRSPAAKYVGKGDDNYRRYIAPWAAVTDTMRLGEDTPHAPRPTCGRFCRPAASASLTASGPPDVSESEPPIEADCPSWNGPGVAVSVCDPERLVAALTRSPVPDSGGPTIGVASGSVEGMPGLAQLSGDPLRPHASVKLTNVKPTAEVRIHAASPQGDATVLFSGLEASGTQAVSVVIGERPEQTRATLPNGRTVSPLRIAGVAAPRRPTDVRARRIRSRVVVSVRAHAVRTTIELARDCRASVLRSRTVKSRPGRTLTVRLDGRRGARVVRATSVTRLGTPSRRATCRRIR